MSEPTEPDGPRWDAAVRLHNALTRVYNNGPNHPFDDLDPEFSQFVQRGSDVGRLDLDDRRVSVGNADQPVLFDSQNVRDYYSGWQILVAAEVAESGIHIRSNMSDHEVASRTRDAIRQRQLPEGTVFELFAPGRALRGFREHESVLDAGVLADEMSTYALKQILQGQRGGRFELTEEQSRSYEEAQTTAARSAMQLLQIDSPAIFATCRFLAGRWEEWDREGRPLVSSAYRTYLGVVIRMLQLADGTTFAAVSEAIGRGQRWFKPILEVIWPDWATEQKERLIRTLTGNLVATGPGAVSIQELTAFADFLDVEHQDGIFLRLSSFERHAFEEVDAPLAGMKGDVQGLAIAVEQTVRAMGGSGDQLWGMFRQLWNDGEVTRLLRENDRLARQGRRPSEWNLVKSEIEQLRQSSTAGAVAADLVTAHRVRGGVHHDLPEDGQFELERVVIALLRAAATTHAHLRRREVSMASVSDITVDRSPSSGG